MKRIISSLTGGLVLAAAIAWGQPRPAFEVVSIHSSPPFSMEAMRSGQIHVGVKVGGAMASYGGQSLMRLICRAYRVETFQVAGPNWLPTARFDIAAKLPDGTSPDRAPEMLQTMLEERFKLALHREQKEFPVYVLIVGKDGLKLKRPPGFDPASTTADTPGSFDSVVPLLRGALERPVIDQTGLKGEYQFPGGDLLMSFNEIPAVRARMDDAMLARIEAAPPGPDTIEVLKNWGLQLEPRRLTMPLLVIDHIERTPTEN